MIFFFSLIGFTLEDFPEDMNFTLIIFRDKLFVGIGAKSYFEGDFMFIFLAHNKS